MTDRSRVPLSRRAFLAVAGLSVAGLAARQGGRTGTALLKGAINGGREPGTHPALPTTPQAFAEAARGAVMAGAGAIHMHVRGANARESVLADDVARVLAAVRAAVPSTPVGVSTTFRIVNDAAKRHALVAEWSVLPDFASVNFNEDGAPELAELLLDRGIGVEAGLFDGEAAEVCVRSGLAPRCLRLMIEPRGSDLATKLQRAADIEAVLDRAGVRPPRLLHGSRGTAWALIDEAARRGYDTRAGLEDTFELPDGTVAPDNAAIVAEARRRILALTA